MRKTLISIFITLAAFVALPMAAAADEPDPTAVRGTVTNNGSPVVGASVSVNCNGNVKTATTNAKGRYHVRYQNPSSCPIGSTATVTATNGSLSGTNSGTVQPESSNQARDVNIALVNVSLAPELGAITAGGAALVGSGAFLVTRRRAAGKQQ